jgi:hypothetical protein
MIGWFVIFSLQRSGAGRPSYPGSESVQNRREEYPMGKVNIGGGSPLKIQFEDDAGNPIDTIEVNGTKVEAKRHWFTTDIMVDGRAWHGEHLNLFRVTEIGPKKATIEYRTGK